MSRRRDVREAACEMLGRNLVWIALTALALGGYAAGFWVGQGYGYASGRYDAFRAVLADEAGVTVGLRRPQPGRSARRIDP